MPPFDVIVDVFKTTILPSVVVSFVAGWLLRKTQYAALAIFLGIVAGNLLSQLLPWWPYRDEMSFLLLAVFLSLFLMELKTKQWLTGTICICIISLMLIQQESQDLVTSATYVLFGMMLYMSLFAAECWLSGRVLMLLCILSGSACSIILIYAHSCLLCQIALLWTCSCGGLALTVLQSSLPIRGVAGPTTIFLQYLLYYGQQTCFSEVPAASYYLAAIAPFPCVLVYLKCNSPLLRLIAVAGWLLLLVLATGLAMYFDDVLIVQ